MGQGWFVRFVFLKKKLRRTNRGFALDIRKTMISTGVLKRNHKFCNDLTGVLKQNHWFFNVLGGRLAGGLVSDRGFG